MSLMQNSAWKKALDSCADPQRAHHYFERLTSTSMGTRLRRVSAEQARVLAALLSGSQALSELLAAHPDWLAGLLAAGVLQRPRWKDNLEFEVQGLLEQPVAAREYAEAYARLRSFKQKEMLRIAARDLGRLGDASEITREISDVADVCLGSVCRLCQQQLAERLGRPFHRDAEGRWQPTQFSVIGLGKLGGQELNYSSDVDVIFVYSEEGLVFKQPPEEIGTTGRGLGNHQFFVRLAEMFIAEVTRLAPEGSLFRIDLRLRPEGKAGPLARSLTSYENYYAQWGQTWERMMLIKARPVAGDPVLAAEVLETIQPFRYPRSLSQDVLQEIAGMKDRIEAEVVKAGEIERNVKLGRGGIREIEFVTQALQLLHGGRNPFLQDPQTLPALEKLARYNFLPTDRAQALTQSYRWLREVEHRLQMENNLQTHTIPTERRARERLAALMGFETVAEFETAHQSHARHVRETYDSLLKAEEPETLQTALPDLDRDRVEWLALLSDCSFRDTERAYHLIREFVHGPGYVHVSSRTVELALRLLPRLLVLCPDPGNSRRRGRYSRRPSCRIRTEWWRGWTVL